MKVLIVMLSLKYHIWYESIVCLCDEVLKEYWALGQSLFRLRKIVGFPKIWCNPFVSHDRKAQVAFVMCNVLDLSNHDHLSCLRCGSTPTWLIFFFVIATYFQRLQCSISTSLCIIALLLRSWRIIFFISHSWSRTPMTMMYNPWSYKWLKSIIFSHFQAPIQPFLSLSSRKCRNWSTRVGNV